MLLRYDTRSSDVKYDFQDGELAKTIKKYALQKGVFLVKYSCLSCILRCSLMLVLLALYFNNLSLLAFVQIFAWIVILVYSVEFDANYFK